MPIGLFSMTRSALRNPNPRSLSDERDHGEHEKLLKSFSAAADRPIERDLAAADFKAIT
jgi:hypothetical protein